VAGVAAVDLGPGSWAISSGVTNSICSAVVRAANSSRLKMPFSPVSM
jgi:hypothetical protein